MLLSLLQQQNIAAASTGAVIIAVTANVAIASSALVAFSAEVFFSVSAARWFSVFARPRRFAGVKRTVSFGGWHTLN